MVGTQHFSPGDIQFQLIYDMGQCAETSYLKCVIITALYNRDLRLYAFLIAHLISKV